MEQRIQPCVATCLHESTKGRLLERRITPLVIKFCLQDASTPMPSARAPFAPPYNAASAQVPSTSYLHAHPRSRY